MSKALIQVLSVIELVIIYLFPMQHLDNSNKGFAGNFQLEFSYQLPKYWMKTIELPHIFIFSLFVSTLTLMLSRVLIKNKIKLVEVIIINGYLIFISYPALEFSRRFLSTVYGGLVFQFELYFTIYFWISWLIALYIIYELIIEINLNQPIIRQDHKLSEFKEIKFWIIIGFLFALPSLLWQADFASSVYYLIIDSLADDHPSNRYLRSVDNYFFIISSTSLTIYISYKLVLNLNLVKNNIGLGHLISCYHALSWLLVFSSYNSLQALRIGSPVMVHIFDTIILCNLAFIPVLIARSRKKSFSSTETLHDL